MKKNKIKLLLTAFKHIKQQNSKNVNKMVMIGKEEFK